MKYISIWNGFFRLNSRSLSIRHFKISCIGAKNVSVDGKMTSVRSTHHQTFAEERLRRLLVFVKYQGTGLVDALKAHAETSGLLEKLVKGLDLFDEKKAEARQAGRQLLMELLASEELQEALAKLPEPLQGRLRQRAEDLKKALQNGIVAPSGSSFFFRSVRM